MTASAPKAGRCPVCDTVHGTVPPACGLCGKPLRTGRCIGESAPCRTCMVKVGDQLMAYAEQKASL